MPRYALFAGAVALCGLPLLAWAGFVVDAPKSDDALDALSILYAVVPCILKIFALVLLLFVVKEAEDDIGADVVLAADMAPKQH